MIDQKKSQQLRKLAISTIDRIGDFDRAIGWMRYEEIRKLSPRQHLEICDRNLAGENFDDMIDDLVIDRIK